MYYYVTKKNDCVLMHHGTKGMHWGIRRYQNLDGTLTEEGRNRLKTNEKFRKKVERYRNEDRFRDEGLRKSEAKRAAKYMSKGLNRKDAMNKAQKVSNRHFKTAVVVSSILGTAGTIALSALGLNIASKLAPSISTMASTAVKDIAYAHAMNNFKNAFSIKIG